ncbi:MAG: hypothetical protein AAF581_15255 [Planctomycetota bacterium]
MQAHVFLVSALLALGLATAASAQTGLSTLAISDASAGEGLLYRQDVTLEISTMPMVQGLSFSVCHDNNMADVVGSELSDYLWNLSPSLAAWSHVGRSNNLAGSAKGAAAGIVLDTFGSTFFPANVTMPIMHIYYVADPGTAGATSLTAFCDTVNIPNVETSIVCCGSGGSVLPGPNLATVTGTATYIAASEQWTFAGADQIIRYDVVTGAATQNGTPSIPLTIANTPANTSMTDSAGFTMALQFDPAFATVSGVVPGAAIAQLNGGSGPDFFSATSSGVEIVVDAIHTAVPTSFVFPFAPDFVVWSGQEAVKVELVIDPSSLAGNAQGDSTILQWQPAGSPNENSVALLTGDFDLTYVGAIDLHDVTLLLLPSTGFVRGDCNLDGSFQIADPITLLNHLFAGGSVNCQDACDNNDDGQLNLADALLGLAALFQGAGTLPAPSICAPDPTLDALHCLAPIGC